MLLCSKSEKVYYMNVGDELIRSQRVHFAKVG